MHANDAPRSKSPITTKKQTRDRRYAVLKNDIDAPRSSHPNLQKKNPSSPMTRDAQATIAKY
jgi:hypothetical protein